MITCLIVSHFALCAIQYHNVNLLYSINQRTTDADWLFSDTALACFIPLQMVINSIIFFIIYPLRGLLHIIAPLIALVCACGILIYMPTSIAEYKGLLTYGLIYLPSILLNVILLLVQKSISPAE